MSEEMTSAESMESEPVESTVSNEVTETTSTPEPSSPPQQSSVWDSFKGLPDFEGKDDADIARSLYQSMEREKAAVRQLQQYQQLIPYAQEYMEHREPFEQWRNSRNQPQQQAPVQQAPQEKNASWWNPPEVKPEHKRYLVRDEAGREVIAENAPLDARYAIENYMQHRAEFAQKFLDNPQEALGPMVAEMAQKQAQELFESQMSDRDADAAVQSLEEENADWLYEADGRTPSEEGLAVQAYIQQAASLGIYGVQARWDYASAMVERDLLNKIRERQATESDRQKFESALSPAASQPAEVQAVVPPPEEAPAAASGAQNSAERDIDFLRREASRNPSRSAGKESADGSPNNLSFEERLKAQLQRDNLI